MSSLLKKDMPNIKPIAIIGIMPLFRDKPESTPIVKHTMNIGKCMTYFLSFNDFDLHMYIIDQLCGWLFVFNQVTTLAFDIQCMSYLTILLLSYMDEHIVSTWDSASPG